MSNPPTGPQKFGESIEGDYSGIPEVGPQTVFTPASSSPSSPVVVDGELERLMGDVQRTGQTLLGHDTVKIVPDIKERGEANDAAWEALRSYVSDERLAFTQAVIKRMRDAGCSERQLGRLWDEAKIVDSAMREPRVYGNGGSPDMPESLWVKPND